jgi:neutral ceramidase
MDGDLSRASPTMIASNWRAGVATATITPNEPMWLAGWAARREPASGKATELSTKALALEDARGGRVLIITADLIAIPRELAQQIGAELQARCGITRDRILFNASHTHTGPEVRPDKVPFFEIPAEFAAKIGPFVSGLAETMTSAGAAALERLQPATLTVRTGRADFARNRRSTEGPTDPEVPILAITHGNGKALAVVFGFACHNLTLPSSFCQYHDEYAGVAQRELEEAFPGTVALFLSGAGADQDPFPRGGPEHTERHGRALALAVRQSLEGPGRAVTGTLKVGFREVHLDFAPVPAAETLIQELQSNDPPQRRKAEYLLAALKENRPFPKSYPCPVQVLCFGSDLLLIALGGEPTIEYALQFKTKSAGPMVWVLGYSNDMFGYIPTRRVQREGGYEASRAMLWSALPGPFIETVEERVVGAVRILIEEICGGGAA